MPRFQFPEWTENFKKALGLLLAGGPVYLIAVIAYGVTPEAIRIGYQPEQPVPYSHALHVGELGLDCRYCHNTVEESPRAAVPPSATCMNCHTGILADSPLLLPIRESYAQGTAVEWVRVHDLPDYVYFSHAAHVNRGVGCESCHGRIDQMEVVYQAKPLTMEWCLDCHRDPGPHLRPLDKVTMMGFDRKKDRHVSAETLAQTYNIDLNNPATRTDCSTCHR